MPNAQLSFPQVIPIRSILSVDTDRVTSNSVVHGDRRRLRSQSDTTDVKGSHSTLSSYTLSHSFTARLSEPVQYTT